MLNISHSGTEYTSGIEYLVSLGRMSEYSVYIRMLTRYSNIFLSVEIFVIIILLLLYV